MAAVLSLGFGMKLFFEERDYLFYRYLSYLTIFKDHFSFVDIFIVCIVICNVLNMQFPVTTFQFSTYFRYILLNCS